MTSKFYTNAPFIWTNRFCKSIRHSSQNLGYWCKICLTFFVMYIFLQTEKQTIYVYEKGEEISDKKNNNLFV